MDVSSQEIVAQTDFANGWTSVAKITCSMYGASLTIENLEFEQNPHCGDTMPTTVADTVSYEVDGWNTVDMRTYDTTTH